MGSITLLDGKSTATRDSVNTYKRELSQTDSIKQRELSQTDSIKLSNFQKALKKFISKHRDDTARKLAEIEIALQKEKARLEKELKDMKNNDKNSEVEISEKLTQEEIKRMAPGAIQ